MNLWDTIRSVSTKRYFYVDESGQDTKGELFVVAVVITDSELDLWRSECEAIEKQSKKELVSG